MAYLYETHLHTYPASRCGHASVEDTVLFYKSFGYDGIFVTNHYLNGNCGADRSLPFEERLAFYFADYYEAVEVGERVGLKVFLGVEMSSEGADFLVFGLTPDWYAAHPEILEMRTSALLTFLRQNGAFVSEAHPFREAPYLDHVHLYPRHVDAIEVINACSPDRENDLAETVAASYDLLRTAGSDNHSAGDARRLAGLCSDTPLSGVEDFISALRAGTLSAFVRIVPHDDSEYIKM